MKCLSSVFKGATPVYKWHNLWRRGFIWFSCNTGNTYNVSRFPSKYALWVPFSYCCCHFSSARSSFQRRKQSGRVFSCICTSRTRRLRCTSVQRAPESLQSPTASSSSCLKKSMLCFVNPDFFLYVCRIYCNPERLYLRSSHQPG